MAEALARYLAADVMEPSSAGISPLGRIVDPTRKILLERGVSVGDQFSKGLKEAPADCADLVVNMTGIPGQSLFPNCRVVDWDVGDPYGEEMDVYRRIRDEIEERVVALADELRSTQTATR
jgi:arsenate reductase